MRVKSAMVLKTIAKGRELPAKESSTALWPIVNVVVGGVSTRRIVVTTKKTNPRLLFLTISESPGA